MQNKKKTHIEILPNQEYVVRRVEENKWAGIKQFNFTNDDFGINIDDVGLPVTGLTEDHFTTDKEGRKIQVKGTRRQLEEELGYDEGTLKKGSILKPNPFWVDYSIKIGGDDLKLNSAIPDHLLMLYVIGAQTQVAHGIENRKAKTEYVLFTRKEEAIADNKQKRARLQAYVLFDKLSLDDQKEILAAAKNINVGSLSPDEVYNKLSDYMEDKPKEFIAIAEDPARQQKAYVRALLNRAVLHLGDDGDSIVYGESVLGYNVPSAAEKLFSAEMADVREAIKIKIKDLK